MVKLDPNALTVSTDAEKPPSANRPLSARSCAAYGVGGIAENTAQNAVTVMVNPIYNIGLLVSPILLGIAVAIFRLWDAFTDPIMGLISDRTISRWGKRRPYVLIGAVLAGFFFALVWWMPLGRSEFFYFLYLSLTGIAFYTCATIFGIPYLAMGYELSADYHERTRIMAYRTWFSSLSGMMIQWLFWFTQRDMFGSTIEGMRYAGLIVGAILLTTGSIAALCSNGPDPRYRVKATTIQLPVLGWKSIREILSIRPFRLILLALSSAILGLFTVGILGFYINIYYVFGGDLKAASVMVGISGTFYHLGCLASLPMVTKISARIGKRGALLVFLGLAVLASILKWFLFTPVHPYLQLVVVGMMAPGLSAVWTLLASMTADTTDLDELEFGTRREGLFGSFYSWTMKFGFALCAMVSGYILTLSGFDAALGAEQAPQTVNMMRFFFSAVPALGLLGTMLCVAWFPIDEIRSAEIRSRLDDRHLDDVNSASATS